MQLQHTLIHVHTHTHSCTYMHIHTFTHTNTHTHTLSYMHICTLSIHKHSRRHTIKNLGIETHFSCSAFAWKEPWCCRKAERSKRDEAPSRGQGKITDLLPPRHCEWQQEELPHSCFGRTAEKLDKVKIASFNKARLKKTDTGEILCWWKDHAEEEVWWNLPNSRAHVPAPNPPQDLGRDVEEEPAARWTQVIGVLWISSGRRRLRPSDCSFWGPSTGLP